MKPFIVLAVLFSFILKQAATAAEDAPRSNPSSARASAPVAKGNPAPARSATGVRNPAAIAGAGKARLGPGRNLGRNYPNAAQATRRGPLAMNTVRPGRNFQPKQTPEMPSPGAQVRGAGPGTKPAKPANNNDIANNRRRTDNNNRNSYADALKRCHRGHHDRNWWRRHCNNIVFVNFGYYYLNAGYWYPAYGYDPAYNYYDYDGPIYTYGDLLPDQVIANVQAALKEMGYYVGPVTGSLGPATRAALGNFQRDYGLVITGAVDEPTVQSLGLI